MYLWLQKMTTQRKKYKNNDNLTNLKTSNNNKIFESFSFIFCNLRIRPALSVMLHDQFAVLLDRQAWESNNMFEFMQDNIVLCT